MQTPGAAQLVPRWILGGYSAAPVGQTLTQDKTSTGNPFCQAWLGWWQRGCEEWVSCGLPSPHAMRSAQHRSFPPLHDSPLLWAGCDFQSLFSVFRLETGTLDNHGFVSQPAGSERNSTADPIGTSLG